MQKSCILNIRLFIKNALFISENENKLAFRVQPVPKHDIHHNWATLVHYPNELKTINDSNHNDSQNPTFQRPSKKSSIVGLRDIAKKIEQTRPQRRSHN